MAPSLAMMGAAALACASSVNAILTGPPTVIVAPPVCVPGSNYELDTLYKGETFFDGFEFKTARDLSNGFVKYLSKSEAQNKNIIKSTSDDVTIGVDKVAPTGSDGRGSVRIESHKSFESGLFVARFKHFPSISCGAWPAFWMYGPGWPDNGEIDIYEQWNEAQTNSITAHTNDTVAGACTLDQNDFTGQLETSNCDIDAPNQFNNQGCSVHEGNGQWGKAAGGTYAVQWTDEFIKVWSWPTGGVPANVHSATPLPELATWGKPHWAVTKAKCNVEKSFNAMKIVININLCGDTAGHPELWKQTCKAKKNKDSCNEYVGGNVGNDFDELYWKIEDIKVFQNVKKTCPAPSSALPSSAAPSSVAPSSAAPSSAAPSSAAPSSAAPSSAAPSSVAPSSAPPSSVAPSSVAPSVAPSSVAPSVAPSSVAPSSAAPSSAAPSSAPPSSISAPPSSVSEAPESSYCEDESSTVPSAGPSSVAPSSAAPSSAGPSSVAPSSGVPSAGPSSVAPSSGVPSAGPSSVAPSVISSGHPSVGPSGINPSSFASSSWTVSVTSSTKHWPSASSSTHYTTSTVYSTHTYTVSKCPATVKHCPYGAVTTEVVAAYTTVCPVTTTDSWPSKPTGGAGGKPDWTQGGKPPAGGEGDWPAGGDHPNGGSGSGSWPAPGGSKSGSGSWPVPAGGAAPTKGSGSGSWPAPGGGAGGDWPAGAASPSKSSGSWPAGGAAPAASQPAGSWPKGGSNSTTGAAKPVTAGAFKAGVSMVGVLAGAFLVLGL